ncbi:MAG: sensor domain-containing diguanylate cyclase [Planctomycetota bacterium]
MIGPRPIDVLLVGEGLAGEAEALVEGGLAVETCPDCLQAIVTLAHVRARVVVFPLRDAEGRLRETTEGLRDAGDDPELLVRIPPEYESAELSDSGLPTIEEPFFPEQFLHRVRVQLERDRDRALGLSPDGPALGSEALSGLIADIADLNRHVPNFESLVDALIGIFMRRTGAKRASLLLYDRKKKQLVLKRAEGFPDDLKVEERIPLGRGIAGRAAEEARPILVKDVSEEPWAGLANDGGYRTSSCISLPLMAGDTLQGILNLADRGDGRPFDEADLTLLARLAPQAGLTLDNSRRLRHLRALSIIDDLTGLYNRRFFRRYLDREFRRALRYKRPLTLAILDLDHFKAFNDLNGHEAGNRALKKIGEILRASFRNTDIACRYGGEEFAVILPETDKGAGFVPDHEGDSIGAFRFLERVRASIEEEKFENEERLPTGKLTISGGVASYPADAETVEDLLEAADKSLYLAKAEGKNRVYLA